MMKAVNILQRLKENKDSAYKMWERVYQDALAGKVDREMIGHAIQMCNVADAAFYEEQFRENERARLKDCKIRMRV